MPIGASVPTRASRFCSCNISVAEWTTGILFSLTVLPKIGPVILFNNAGVASTSGETPSTIDAMADHVATFVNALALTKVDVLGFSIGGYVAQAFTLRHSHLVRQYLGQSHRDEAEKGCAFAALSPEIARQDKGTRTILEKELEAYIDIIARHVGGTDKNVAQAKALQIFSLMLGALQLARAAPDAAHSDHILKSAGEAVRLLTSPKK